VKYFSYALALLLSLTLTACGGSGEQPQGKLLAAPNVIATLTTAQLDAITAGSGLQPLTGTAKCDVSMAQINYQTSGVQPGELSNASAAVLIPSGTNCPGPFPLVAFARGTNLYKSHTNADPTDPTAQILMNFFAAQGYAVVATDYLGYALSSYSYHPYMHADSEASAVIDSIRATRLAASSLGLALNGKVMVSGYSQGGHAAMATQRAIEQHNSGEFNLVASAPLAGPYNVSGALVDGATNPIVGVQDYVPFQITAYQEIYGNVYSSTSDIFNAPYDGYIANLFPATVNAATLTSMLPGGTPAQAEQAMFKSAYLNDLATNPNNATIVAAAKQNLLLGWDPKAPTRLCGGSGDPTVKFLINAVPAYNGFISRGDTNVTLVDVDPEVQQAFGSLDPATYNSEYHGALESPFCAQVAKQFFDLYK
jgi:pimeloyl-ACP methyl ester carboxylesterase